MWMAGITQNEQINKCECMILPTADWRHIIWFGFFLCLVPMKRNIYFYTTETIHGKARIHTYCNSVQCKVLLK